MLQTPQPAYFAKKQGFPWQILAISMNARPSTMQWQWTTRATQTQMPIMPWQRYSTHRPPAPAQAIRRMMQTRGSGH
jgi:hypothetical protein